MLSSATSNSALVLPPLTTTRPCCSSSVSVAPWWNSRLNLSSFATVLWVYPRSLIQALGLARLVEPKLFDSRASRPLRLRAPLLCWRPTFSAVTAWRLSPVELQERRTKCLCFNCDEKFGPGHRCKVKQFMLLLSDGPPDLFDSCPDPEDVPLSPEAALTDGVLFQLSPAAVSGSSSPRTLCRRGLIRGHAVSVLIDSGNSHNIIQPRVATFLSLAESSLPSFSRARWQRRRPPLLWSLPRRVIVTPVSQLLCFRLCHPDFWRRYRTG
ncbi:hypothetical protein Sango_1177900 [Sesamum angolense]|uniref:Uncharacterized protein n=1 Tax=Sesamum angolense TaxID=2727404 RepID=A0AAE1WVY7_9LAMI|nr:hypothetical protein Sango_1177900 [Sesamum angolense]